MAQKQPNAYFRYSNLAIQMGLIIGLFSWGGVKLDEKYHNDPPIFTIILSLAGIGIALYIVIRDVLKSR